MFCLSDFPLLHQRYDTGIWFQEICPALFEFDVEKNPAEPLIEASSKRTVFHVIAATDPKSIKCAVAFNFVSAACQATAAKNERVPPTTLRISDRRDIYGWKTSDYLIAHGDMDSLLALCTYTCTSDSMMYCNQSMPPIDFFDMIQCSDLFIGPNNLLKQVPPELSATLGAKDWPAAGKSPRQLAHDLGHVDIVEFIDFLQFHAGGHLLLHHVTSKNAFVEGAFASVKATASTFTRHVEANSTYGYLCCIPRIRDLSFLLFIFFTSQPGLWRHSIGSRNVSGLRSIQERTNS